VYEISRENGHYKRRKQHVIVDAEIIAVLHSSLLENPRCGVVIRLAGALYLKYESI
jgi:hypothetical protein